MASAVRLTMQGEIKLKEWNAFEAQEVIQWRRGFIWRATVRMSWAFLRGGDSFVDGTGAMRLDLTYFGRRGAPASARRRRYDWPCPAGLAIFSRPSATSATISSTAEST